MMAEPICPMCGHAFEDLYEYGLENDGDDTVTECGWCEFPVRLRVRIQIDYEVETLSHGEMVEERKRYWKKDT